MDTLRGTEQQKRGSLWALETIWNWALKPHELFASPIPFVILLFGGNFVLFAITVLNPINSKLNTICHLLALVEAHPIFHVSRIRVKLFYFLFV
jgi:hypothetical protein